MIDLSTIDARKALGTKYGAIYALDPALICAVCEQESSWNPWAMRYEPAFYQRYIQPMFAQPTTEATARATSYGLMQVMGEVARELGFSGPYLSELCDPDTGISFGCKKLAQCLKAQPNTFAALMAYNGGGNGQYAQQVLNRMAKYQ